MKNIYQTIVAAILLFGTTFTANAVVPRFAYVANINDGTVSTYAVNAATGELSARDVVVSGSAPYWVGVDPSGKFAYVANSGANRIAAYTIDAATGVLKLVGTTVTGITPHSFAFDPSGRFGYVSNYNSNTVSAYAINARTGALTFIGTVPAGIHPSPVTVTPGGKFAYVANAVSNTVSAYAINADSGALAPVGTFATGSSPQFISIDPSGTFAYVANGNSNNVSAYAINAGSGALSAIGTFATGILPTAIAIDPSGRFAYVSNYRSHNVSAYRVDATTGALTLAGTVSAGTNPSAVSVDPSGKFVYAANIGADTLSAYAIDTATGTLTPLAVPTVAARSKPVSIAISRSGGNFDTSFGNLGSVTTSLGALRAHTFNAVALQSDGKTVAAGYSFLAGHSDFTLVRYNRDGSKDASFGANGVVETPIGSRFSRAESIAIQRDGKIVVGGFSTVSLNFGRFTLIRYTTDGNLDLSFGTGGIVTTPIGSGSGVRAVAIQADDKIVAAGSSGESEGPARFTLARYDLNGNLDLQFGTSGIVIANAGVIQAMALQPDAKIVVAGSAGPIGNQDFVVARYNSDGIPDRSFGATGEGFVTTPITNRDDTINALALQPDGKIVVAGTTAVGVTHIALARYNADGSSDNGFGTNGIVITTSVPDRGIAAFGVAIQSNGKIVAAGTAGTDHGADFTLVRYGTNGSLDADFGTNGIALTTIGNKNDSDKIRAIAIQSDDKIVAVGSAGGNSQSTGDFAVARYFP